MEGIKKFEIPKRILDLPKDEKGHFIPWFAQRKEGPPEYNETSPELFYDAVNKHKCWICGHQLGKHRAFTIGVTTAIHQIANDPPSHRECALAAARCCPFFAKEGEQKNLMIVWVTGTYRYFDEGDEIHVKCKLGLPESVYWFTEGRSAWREEVMSAFEMPLFKYLEAATADGPEATVEFHKALANVMNLISQTTLVQERLN